MKNSRTLKVYAMGKLVDQKKMDGENRGKFLKERSPGGERRNTNHGETPGQLIGLWGELTALPS